MYLRETPTCVYREIESAMDRWLLRWQHFAPWVSQVPRPGAQVWAVPTTVFDFHGEPLIPECGHEFRIWQRWNRVVPVAGRTSVARLAGGWLPLKTRYQRRLRLLTRHLGQLFPYRRRELELALKSDKFAHLMRPLRPMLFAVKRAHYLEILQLFGISFDEVTA